jgi:hypothetical protein
MITCGDSPLYDSDTYDTHEYLDPNVAYEDLDKPETIEDVIYLEIRRTCLEVYLDRSVPFKYLPEPRNELEQEFMNAREEQDDADGTVIEYKDMSWIDTIDNFKDVKQKPLDPKYKDMTPEELTALPLSDPYWDEPDIDAAYDAYINNKLKMAKNSKDYLDLEIPLNAFAKPETEDERKLYKSRKRIDKYRDPNIKFKKLPKPKSWLEIAYYYRRSDIVNSLLSYVLKRRSSHYENN